MKQIIYSRYSLFLAIALLVACGTEARNLKLCQNPIVRGTVVNEDKTGIADCTITNKRTHQTVISNSEGAFEILGIFNDTLEITHIDYTTVFVIVPSTFFFKEIILKNRQTTEEEVIVNTGYQLIPRERSSGSFSIISNHCCPDKSGVKSAVTLTR